MPGLLDMPGVKEGLDAERAKIRAEVKKEITGAMLIAIVIAYFLSKEL